MEVQAEQQFKEENDAWQLAAFQITFRLKTRCLKIF